MSQRTNKTPAAAQGGPATLGWLLDERLGNLPVCALVRVESVEQPGTPTTGAIIWAEVLVNLRDGGGGVGAAGWVHAVCSHPSGISCDPVPGDVGFVVVADRDFWAALETGAPAPSRTLHKHDRSDCVYVGTVRSVAPPKIIITAAGVQINAPSFKINGVEFVTHAHNVISLGAPTGPVRPGGA